MPTFGKSSQKYEKPRKRQNKTAKRQIKTARRAKIYELFCTFVDILHVQATHIYIMEQYVALFLDRNLNKAQYALKYLAAQMTVRPVHVYAFLRNGREENGNIADRKTVAKLAEVRQYLQQSKLTFEAIQITGSFDFEEITQTKSTDECLEDLRQRYRSEGKDPHIILLEDGICKSPWTLDEN